MSTTRVGLNPFTNIQTRRSDAAHQRSLDGDVAFEKVEAHLRGFKEILLKSAALNSIPGFEVETNLHQIILEHVNCLDITHHHRIQLFRYVEKAGIVHSGSKDERLLWSVVSYIDGIHSDLVLSKTRKSGPERNLPEAWLERFCRGDRAVPMKASRAWLDRLRDSEFMNDLWFDDGVSVLEEMSDLDNSLHVIFGSKPAAYFEMLGAAFLEDIQKVAAVKPGVMLVFVRHEDESCCFVINVHNAHRAVLQHLPQLQKILGLPPELDDPSIILENHIKPVLEGLGTLSLDSISNEFHSQLLAIMFDYGFENASAFLHSSSLATLALRQSIGIISSAQIFPSCLEGIDQYKSRIAAEFEEIRMPINPCVVFSNEKNEDMVARQLCDASAIQDGLLNLYRANNIDLRTEALAEKREIILAAFLTEVFESP